MRKMYFLLLVVAAIAATAYGWRNQEMEIRFTGLSVPQLEQLRALNLNGEVSPLGDAAMYVIPDELKQVDASGLIYQITIPDLNAHYSGFWQQSKVVPNILVPAGYSTYEQIIAAIDSLVRVFPNICQKIVVGKSMQNRDICVLKISNNVSVHENEAEIVYDAGIHGDEVGGPENLIKFAREICANYSSNPDIKKSVDSREIYLYMMINPDGRVSMSRYNANNVDCNRDYGYMWGAQGGSTAPCSQQEIRVARNFFLSIQPSVQITYHSGQEYVLYPWGFTGNTPPDRTHHAYLANLYATNSTYTTLPVYSSYATYQTFGETIDYTYGCMGTTILTEEISINKQPSDVQGYYDKNVPAMKILIEYAGYGVQGIVNNAATAQPVTAILSVNQGFPFYSDPVVGDYHKFLTAGTYSIRVMANGYTAKTVASVAILDKQTTAVNITLDRDPAAKYAWGYRVVSVQTGGTGNTFSVLGQQDNLYYTLSGANGLVADMQYPIENISGKEITVFISGSTSTYTCYAGQAIDGPWLSLGTSARTDSFDLAAGALSSARYIRIQGANINLDAISGFKSYLTPVLSSPLTGKAGAGIAVFRTNAGYAIRLNGRVQGQITIVTAQGRCCLHACIDNGVYLWRPPGRGMFIIQAASGGRAAIQQCIVAE